MLPFSLGFLAVFLARAPLPAIGLEMAAAALVALAFRLWRAPRPRVELRRATVTCALLGASAAWVPPSAALEGPEVDAPALDARAQVARVEGTVEPGGRIGPRGASFRLQGGPVVRVAGASAIPPPSRRSRSRASSTRPAAS